MTSKYVIGLDFGTDSVRAMLVDARNGKEEAASSAPYRRWTSGCYCDPDRNQFRQHPRDYLEGLEQAVKEALAQASASVIQRIAAIGIDTTGSTPVAVNRDGAPLALLEEFQDNPNAMFILWKDHSAVREAEEINHLAHSWGGANYTKHSGGVYSSEWFWAKILHLLRQDPDLRGAAFSWVEQSDWIPALLTGNTDPQRLKRSRCAAGHKGMWHREWGGLPSEEFLGLLDPLLHGLRGRLYTETYTSEVPAGKLSQEWAERLGLPAGIPVTVGALDAHMGAVGGGIRPGTLAKIMGTSTCDLLVAPPEAMAGKQVAGICGQVDGSIVPGMIGLEAGQSAFGDVYAWFVDLLFWPLQEVQVSAQELDPEKERQLKRDIKDKILRNLTEMAQAVRVEDSGLLALDWLNGRRTPDADQSLKGAIVGLTLGTTAPKIFRALVEATAFGSRAIVDRFLREGVAMEEIIALGGIPSKSPFVMQVTADVLNMPIRVVASEQSCALGAAMFAAVAAGEYEDIPQAQSAMGAGFSRTYDPNPEQVPKYQTLYGKYLALGNTLGSQLREL